MRLDVMVVELPSPVLVDWPPQLLSLSPGSVELNWTASGDDGATGRAGFYDVR